VPFDWEKASTGTKIVQTNTILYDGLQAAGIPGSARTVSSFCYFEPVKALWKPEYTGPRRDKRVGATVPSGFDYEELEEAGEEFLAIMRRYHDERTVFCSTQRG